MAGRNRILILTAAFILFLGGDAIFSRVAGADARESIVRGIVRNVSGTVVSVGGDSYDLKGVPIGSAVGPGRVELSSITGKTIEIVFRNNRIESVTVYRTLQQ